jgi:arginase family enzyme
MDEAVECILKNGLPIFISFDHDLADDHYLPGSTYEKTGATFARWLIDWIIDNDIVIPDDFNYYVHSMNPVGAENIRSLMASFLRTI